MPCIPPMQEFYMIVPPLLQSAATVPRAKQSQEECENTLFLRALEEQLVCVTFLLAWMCRLRVRIKAATHRAL